MEKWLKEGRARCGQSADHGSQGAACKVIVWQVSENNTSQQDFGTRKVYCVSNVTFHAESKYVIKIFPITHSFCTMAFLIIDFSEFLVFSSVIFFVHEQIF